MIADARQKLANIEFLRGDVPHSSVLLGQAEKFWATSPQAYREERLEGLDIRSKIQRAQGDIEGAIRTSRAAIAERTKLFGRNDRETATLYNSLAITLMSANQLEEALAAYRDTMEIYHAIGLADGLDAQIILANIGTLELRTGDPTRPRPTEERVRARTRARRGFCGGGCSDGLLRAGAVDSGLARASRSGLARG